MGWNIMNVQMLHLLLTKLDYDHWRWAIAASLWVLGLVVLTADILHK